MAKAEDLQKQLEMYQRFGQEAGNQYSALTAKQRAALDREAARQTEKRKYLMERVKKQSIAAENPSIWTKEFNVPHKHSVFGIHNLAGWALMWAFYLLMIWAIISGVLWRWH